MLRMREPRPISPAAIERRYRQANPEGHWFDPDTMRFFRSRLSQGFVDSLERVGFVSSEQTIFGPRRWSVRRLDPDGTLDNVREFQAFATRSEALAAAVRCARLA